MSIFGSIMSKIFGHGSAQAANASPTLAPSGSPTPTATPTSAPAQTVDVAAIVDKAAAARVAHIDRRLDEGARSRQQLDSAQAAREGTTLHRRHQ
jgi:hypothetical protein